MNIILLLRDIGQLEKNFPVDNEYCPDYRMFYLERIGHPI